MAQNRALSECLRGLRSPFFVLWPSRDCGDRWSIGSTQYAAFRNDSGDVFCRCRVERGVLDTDSVRRELLAAVVRYVAWRALFDSVGLFEGQAGLVEEANTRSGPFKCGNHASSV
jgi:hypothetical protein